MTKLRVAVNGAKGKMGTTTVEAIRQAQNFELVGAFDHDVVLTDAIKNCDAQIVVDFTTANSAFENAKIIIASGAHPVIGTTGFTPEQIAELTTLCTHKNLGAIIAPNFSIAALLMMRTAKECAKYLPDVEIIETHHENKADAPSGTAIKTAELIASARTSSPSEAKSKELLPGALGAIKNGIRIHSLRLPGFVAQQEVIFGSQGESLHIKHNTTDRSAFMPGVLLACAKVTQLTTLVYGLEELLF
ncbi:MAG: 4-hydroxy-tetrahydrodipicolinate reductase [Pseudomonadota bacterium]|nr:4-hydroxy-tetrahydrodipicolinate reductase [Pseudomonadota bacterium]